MKDFFAKHRHLIVISLILAVILAALTPLLVPLGLELEERFDLPDLRLPTPIQRFSKLKAEGIQYYMVHCDKFPYHAENRALFQRATWRNREEIAALCAILNEAPISRNKDSSDAEQLLTIRLYEAKDSNGQSASYGYTLVCSDGQYSLKGGGRLGGRASWYISEESALALLGYCYCTKDAIHGHPRQDLCDADHITSASLLTWAERKKSDPVDLTQEQIETLCTFLEEQLLPARYSRTKYAILPHGTNGWQVTLSTRDGLTWQVQYNDSQNCLSLCCVFSSQRRQEAAIGYTCKDEAAIAALPELILAAGQ